MGSFVFQIGLFGIYNSSKALGLDAVDTYLEEGRRTGGYPHISQSAWVSFKKEYGRTWLILKEALEKAQELSETGVFKLSFSSPFLPEKLDTVFRPEVRAEYEALYDLSVSNSCAQALFTHHGDAENEEAIIGLTSIFAAQAKPYFLPTNKITFLADSLSGDTLFSQENLAAYKFLKNKHDHLEAWVRASELDGSRKAISTLAHLDWPVSPENVACATRLERLGIDFSEENIRGFEVFDAKFQAHVSLLDDSFKGVSKAQAVGIYYKEWASLQAEEKDKESALFHIMGPIFGTRPPSREGILDFWGITLSQEVITASEEFGERVQAQVSLLDDFVKWVPQGHGRPAFYIQWTTLHTEAKKKESALLHLMCLNLQISPQNMKAVMELRGKGAEYRSIKQSDVLEKILLGQRSEEETPLKLMPYFFNLSEDALLEWQKSRENASRQVALVWLLFLELEPSPKNVEALMALRNGGLTYEKLALQPYYIEEYNIWTLDKYKENKTNLKKLISDLERLILLPIN